MKKYDLAVAYRIYPRISLTPLFYNEDKYMLSQLCLKSFKNALEGLNVRIWAILDGCPQKYEDLFRLIFNTTDLTIVKTKSIGNYRTTEIQYNILCRQSESEYIYIAEDDYLYRPATIFPMINFLTTNPDVHFLTPYDHPDYHDSIFHSHKRESRKAGDINWRSVNSTTFTFLTTRSNFRAIGPVFATRRWKNNDSSIWISLTKPPIINPLNIIRYQRFGEKFLSESVAFAWLFCWWQILFGKKWKLWAPEPSLGTHMERKYIAKGVNWLEVKNNIEIS